MEKVASSGTAQVLCHHGCGDAEKETLKYLIFQDRFDILVGNEVQRCSRARNKMLYGKSQMKELYGHK